MVFPPTETSIFLRSSRSKVKLNVWLKLVGIADFEFNRLGGRDSLKLLLAPVTADKSLPRHDGLPSVGLPSLFP